MMFFRFILSILIILIVSPVSALPRVIDLMKKMESDMEMTTDFSAKVNITFNQAGQGVRVSEFIYFRCDKTDEFLLVFTKPESEKGNGYLRTGDNMWMYRKNTRTFQHITRDDEIGGSDAQSGDFEKKKFTELYKPYTDKNGKEDIKESKLGNRTAYQFTLIATDNDATYPKQVFWIERSTNLGLKVQQYSVSGTLMFTNYYPKYTRIKGRYLAVSFIIVDEFEKGNKTLVDISGISLDPLDKKIFTKPYLENLSK